MAKSKDPLLPEGYFSESPARVFRPGVKPPVRIDLELSPAEVENILARKRITAHLDAIKQPRCHRCGQMRPIEELRQRANGDWECRSARKCGGI
jgi:hypothetical protein